MPYTSHMTRTPTTPANPLLTEYTTAVAIDKAASEQATRGFTAHALSSFTILMYYSLKLNACYTILRCKCLWACKCRCASNLSINRLQYIESRLKGRCRECSLIIGCPTLALCCCRASRERYPCAVDSQKLGSVCHLGLRIQRH